METDRIFQEWSKIPPERLSDALAIVLRVAFDGGWDAAMRHKEAELARSGIISGDDARRLEHAMLNPDSVSAEKYERAKADYDSIKIVSREDKSE